MGKRSSGARFRRKTAPFCDMLRGGDRRSIGKSNHVVTQVLQQPKRFGELMQCLWGDDLLVPIRAADAAAKVSREKPKLLHEYHSELLGLACETKQAEIRRHMAFTIPRLSLSRVERARAIEILKAYLADRSSIVKTWSLQALHDLAQGDAEHEREMAALLEETSRNGTPAMRARSRILLKQIQAKERCK